MCIYKHFMVNCACLYVIAGIGYLTFI